MTSNHVRALASLAFCLPVLVAAPAFAGEATSQAPTRALGTDEASVLADELSYLDVGGAAGGGAGGYTLGYAHGFGGNSELGIGLSALFHSAGGGVTGNLGAAYKHSLSNGDRLTTAILGNVFLNGIGATTTVGARVGLPLTFDVGTGHLTVEPRVTLPNLATGTAGGDGEVALGVGMPINDRWTFLGDITPTFGFGGGFTLPIAVGARFAPTATSSVDFTFGDFATTPAFDANIGLFNVLGHVGF